MNKYKLRYLPLFYDDAEKIVSYVANTLSNPIATRRLIDDIEKAIIERLESAESFQKYESLRPREHPYYKIRVRNFLVFYVVIEEGHDKVMEVRRLLYGRRNIEQNLI